MKNTRREFLKKVAYTAPVVVGLGVLAAPLSANASLTRAAFKEQYKTDYLNDHTKQEWKDEGKSEFVDAWKNYKKSE
jgi:hypothetical protein